MPGQHVLSRRSALVAAFGATLGWRGRLYGREKATAFALIGDRYHNSDYIRIGLGRTIGREAGVSIDFCDEVKILDAETLAGRKLLIMLRDGMLWPDGHEDESSNAAWAGEGTPRLILGLGFGLPLAMGATRWIKSFLFGVPPVDPAGMGAAVLLLAAVSTLAGFLPARRATKVDPMTTLRHE